MTEDQQKHRKLAQRAHNVAEEVEANLDDMVQAFLHAADDARLDISETLTRAGERLTRAGKRMSQKSKAA